MWSARRSSERGVDRARHQRRNRGVRVLARRAPRGTRRLIGSLQVTRACGDRDFFGANPPPSTPPREPRRGCVVPREEVWRSLVDSVSRRARGASPRSVFQGHRWRRGVRCGGRRDGEARWRNASDSRPTRHARLRRARHPVPLRGLSPRRNSLGAVARVRPLRARTRPGASISRCPTASTSTPELHRLACALTTAATHSRMPLAVPGPALDSPPRTLHCHRPVAAPPPQRPFPPAVLGRAATATTDRTRTLARARAERGVADQLRRAGLSAAASARSGRSCTTSSRRARSVGAVVQRG